MARVLESFVEPVKRCVYLSDQLAAQEVRIMLDVSPEEYEALLVRGHRRFGPVYFRPACSACAECMSIRVPTALFRPSQSQRRAARACRELRVSVGQPFIDGERLSLYAKWHARREEERGWAPAPADRDAYYQSFAFPHPSVREIAFHDDSAGGRLVGVGISDETPHAWSAVYFFYDPDYARRSLGVANVLTQISLARARGIPYVYLGYRVEGCPSLVYKSQYRPHELLVGRPGPDEEPCWLPQSR